MLHTFYILFGAVYTVAVSLALGRILLRRTGIHACLFLAEQLLFSFLAGSALLSLIVFLLAAAGLSRKGVFLWVGIAALAAGLRRFRGALLPPLPKTWKWIFVFLFGAYCILYFFNAMAPEISPDGSGYHLGLVLRYLRDHGFQRLTTNIYGNLSQGVEMLFLFAFAFGRHSSAALVHFTFLVALACAMVWYGRRFGLGAAAVCAAILVFASPVAGIDGTSAYVDVAAACIIFGLFYLLQLWESSRHPGFLLPIGILAGFAYAAKYSAFLALPYALLFIFLKCRGKRQPWLRPAVTVSLAAALLIAPWIVKNWILVQNPFSPFLNRWFPNPFVTIAFERDYSGYLRHYNYKSYAEVPWDAAVYGATSGMFGPVFLLAPVALLALRWREGRSFLLAAAVFGAPYLSNLSPRFCIPALPFLALAMAQALLSIRGLAPGVVVAHAILSWPSVMPAYCWPWAWRLTGIPVRAALRLQPEEEFLGRNMATYHGARWIERSTPEKTRIFSFSPLPEAYLKRNLIVSFYGAENEVIADTLRSATRSVAQPTWRWRFRFPRERLRAARVTQTAAGDDLWSVHELSITAGDAAVQPLRVAARPNPWGVSLAFDGNPATRWRTWEAVQPGMYLEAELPQPAEADSVTLLMSPDQHQIRLKLELEDAAGHWRTVASEPSVDDVPPPPGLRLDAMRAVKQHGIDYLALLMNDIDAPAFEDAAAWGLIDLGEFAGVRLYRLP